MLTSKLIRHSVNGEKSEKMRKELEFALSEVEALRSQQRELVARIENLISPADSRNDRSKEIFNRANFNPTSGLPNQNLLELNLMNFLDSGKRNSESGAIILLKLDNNFNILSIFKLQKTSISNWLIYQTRLRLKECVGEGGSIYHIRNDEFLLHIFRISSVAELSSFLEKINRQVSKPHIFAGQHIEVDCAIGAALYPKDGYNRSELLNNADIALSEARKKNRNYALFEPRMLENALKVMNTRNSMIQALERNTVDAINRQLYLILQPIVSVNRIEKNEPIIENVDAEALIRWRHPIDGNVLPDVFIPIAEETGIITVIGKWVLYTAAMEIETWKWQQIDSKLAINASPRQFHNDDLIDSIQRIIKQRKIDPEKLQVEITENSFLEDPHDATRKIKRLKDLGINVALDDFGTGFSSINYLSQLPVDAVKIDRSFIGNLTTSTQSCAIVKALIAITQELGMTNIAEGVETIEQLELLMELGISTFQGFLFSKALSPGSYADFYRRYKSNGDT